VPLRVLLVEDNDVNRLLAETHLQALGCEVTSAVNGLQALERWRPGEHDLVLMDCHMPELDGYQTSQRMREIEQTLPVRRRTPIVALTASAMEGDRERCLAAGMDDYLAKPFGRQALARVIESGMACARAGHPAGRPPPSLARQS
jgi:CheY-like chemotaxis protein